jgi:molybdate transport system substrate-binding protein
MSRHVAVSLLTAVLFCFLAAPNAGAAELKVMGAGAVEEPVNELAAAFTRETGHKIEASFGTVGGIEKKLTGGEKADVVILSAPVMEKLDKAGLLAGATLAELGRATAAVGVRAGITPPDVSTPDALKKALLQARSVAYTDPAAGGTIGVFFASLIERLAIADEIKKKAVLQPGGSGVAAAVADGKADIGITFISELLPNKGVQVAGPIPASIGLVIPYVAAVSSASSQADVARALIAYMTTSSAREHFKAAGL